MPRSPQRSTTAGPNYIQVRLPGHLKNELIEHAAKLDCTLNAWLVEAIQTQLRADLALPEPPPAHAPLPTTADMIRQWAVGERVVMPCGRADACSVIDADGRWSHDGMGFCTECGIRVL